MAEDWAAVAAEVAVAIAEVGIPATLTKAATLDESGTLPSLVPGADHLITAVQGRMIDQDKEGSNVRAGDSTFMVEAIGVVPGIGDKITFSGRRYDVVSVEATQPAETPVLFTVFARGA